MRDMEDSGGSLSGEPGRSRRGRPRDLGVDEAILAAAVDLLAEVGYARLTMEQVAARAGVGKASLYLRWPSKVALVAEAIQHRSGVAPKVPDTGSLREDMLAFLRALLRRKSAAQRALAALTGEIASNPELRKAWRRGVAGTLLACLRLIVEQAIERGELPAASDVELLSMLPLTLLQNWRLDHDQGPDDAVVERIVDQFYTPAPRRAPVESVTQSNHAQFLSSSSPSVQASKLATPFQGTNPPETAIIVSDRASGPPPMPTTGGTP